MNNKTSFITIIQYIDTTSNIAGILSRLSIFFAALLIITEIFSRNILGYSLHITDEYTGYLMALSCFFGFSYVEKLHGHIQIGILGFITKKYPHIAHTIKTLRYMLALCFSGYLFYSSSLLWVQSIQYAACSMQYSKTPLAFPQIALPLGTLLLCLQYMANLYRHLWLTKTSEQTISY